jgi:hypothetical protein
MRFITSLSAFLTIIVSATAAPTTQDKRQGSNGRFHIDLCTDGDHGGQCVNFALGYSTAPYGLHCCKSPQVDTTSDG